MSENKVEYDSFEGKTNIVNDEPASLADIFGIEDDQNTNDVNKNWVGMPEFTQGQELSYKRLVINFRSEEDYQEFARLINQKLTMKTKSCWHPVLDRNANSVLRWIEE